MLWPRTLWEPFAEKVRCKRRGCDWSWLGGRGDMSTAEAVRAVRRHRSRVKHREAASYLLSARWGWWYLSHCSGSQNILSLSSCENVQKLSYYICIWPIKINTLWCVHPLQQESYLQSTLKIYIVNESPFEKQDGPEQKVLPPAGFFLAFFAPGLTQIH